MYCWLTIVSETLLVYLPSFSTTSQPFGSCRPSMYNNTCLLSGCVIICPSSPNWLRLITAGWCMLLSLVAYRHLAICYHENTIHLYTSTHNVNSLSKLKFKAMKMTVSKATTATIETSTFKAIMTMYWQQLQNWIKKEDLLNLMFFKRCQANCYEFHLYRYVRKHVPVSDN